MKLLPACFLLARLATAQASGEAAGSIDGSVIDSITQTPVKNVNVTLAPTQNVQSTIQPPVDGRYRRQVNNVNSTKTDIAGTFHFANLAPGTYQLFIQHMAYPSIGPRQKSVEVKAGETATARISLTPGAAISGRVVDEDGEPISGCMPVLESSGSFPYGVPMGGSQNTSESGEFRMWGLNAGSYYVRVQCSQPAFQPRKLSSGPPAPPSIGYPPTYYPGAATVASAQIITLKGGEERSGLDFQVKPAHMATLTGVVTLPSSDIQPQITIEALRPDDRLGMGRQPGRVDAKTGQFQITGMFAGSYELVAIARSQQGQALFVARQQTEVGDEDPKPVALNLVAGTDLAGSVTVESDQPSRSGSITIQLVPKRPTAMSAPPQPVSVDKGGSFTLKGVFPGEWTVMAMGQSIFLKRLELGGQSFEGKSFTFANGAAGPLHVVVSDRLPRVTISGTPGHNYSVVQVVNESFPMVFNAMAEPSGRLMLPLLPPGQYRVYDGQWQAAESSVGEFKAEEGQELTVQLRDSESR